MSLESRLESLSSLKDILERLFGRQAWSDLKMSTSLPTWKRHLLKAVDAVRVGIDSTVTITDERWIKDVDELLTHGRGLMRSAKNIDDLLSTFSATLLELVFLQLGRVPERATSNGVTLDRRYWTLNNHRSVQYVQSAAQAKTLFWDDQQRQIGVKVQGELHDEYVASKSLSTFSSWCKQRGA
jgi:hypothetical protein